MERIARLLGKSARASIVFSALKRLQVAEVTIQAVCRPLRPRVRATRWNRRCARLWNAPKARRAATGTAV